MVSFEQFIKENAGADASHLLLSIKEWPEPDDPVLKDIPPRDLIINTIEGKRRMAKKVPEWNAAEGIVYPTRLAAEQCSSAATAKYKADLASTILSESVEDKKIIADLTGGIGVDTWAFSKVASEVIYNEMNPFLAAAAKHNFPLLGMDNARICSSEAKPGNIAAIVGGSRPSLIFIDPSRRNPEGKKVFLIEDCSPDVAALLPELLGCCRHLLVKLSAMADITMVVERLNRAALNCTSYPAAKGCCVREVHIVAAGGECKELLIWIDSEYDGRHSIVCREDNASMRFAPGETEAGFTRPESSHIQLLFEPGKSLSKSAMFNVIGQRLGLAKLARFTHLYTPVRLLDDEGIMAEAQRLLPYGKVFKVMEVLHLDKAGMKQIGKKYPRSEVTARNLPLTSAELRTRMRVASGDDAHIFGVRMEFAGGSDNLLVVTRPLLP